MPLVSSQRPKSTKNKLRYTVNDLETMPQLSKLGPSSRLAMRAVASVWPFRVSSYVVDSLIDWDQVPDDPMFQLTMPQPGMLEPDDLDDMIHLLRHEAPAAKIKEKAWEIRGRMNPHPGGQMQLNVPTFDDEPAQGIQHKYRETVLFFPSAGQTCHSYCNYCFRWAQFVGKSDLRFAAPNVAGLVNYLERQPDVTDVLITGGDPMIMKTRVLRKFIEPLLAPNLEHVTNIRIGTKSPAFWPARFTCDDDADDLMRLFEQIRQSGKHLSIMVHFSHYRELETAQVKRALDRIRATGANIRCQAPIIRSVNDSADVLKRMWESQVNLGAVPYYAFVERDTGPKHYFQVPLHKAHDVFRTALGQVSGLARTVRGPSMSTTMGKVLIDGIETVQDEKVFVLKFLQARHSEWANRIFFAKFDRHANWINDLRPALGSPSHFFSESVDKHAAAVDV